MAAGMAQWKRSNIKCYASTFSNILMCAKKDQGFMVLQNSFPHCK